MRLTRTSIATAVLAVASLTFALTPTASAAATPFTSNGPGMPSMGSGFPGMPSMGSGFPGMPSMGSGFPGMPSMGGGMPGMPSMGGGMPGMPSMGGGMPGMPSMGGGMPGMPSMGGGMPGMPSMGGGMPGMPGMPSMGGGMPGMPSMGGSQSVPNGFPKEFKAPTNAASGQPATGWGGDPTGKTDGGVVKHVPILFLHGAMRDAHDWDQARQYYLSKGYSPSELWAVSYGGSGMPDAAGGAKTVQAFADNMITYLNQYKNANVTQIDVVTHSMGGSVAMQWINNGNAGKVHSLITIAAPHHGISMMGNQMPGMSGNNPTAPKGVRTMTIYDGTGQYDMFYPNNLKDSPSLEGATNHPYNVEHNTKLDHISMANKTLDLQYSWLKDDLVTAKK